MKIIYNWLPHGVTRGPKVQQQSQITPRGKAGRNNSENHDIIKYIVYDSIYLFIYEVHTYINFYTYKLDDPWPLRWV